MTHNIHKINGTDPTPEKCRENVSNHEIWGDIHRCERNGTVSETVNGVEMKFCKQHSEAERARKDLARRAKWDAGNRLQRLRNDAVRMKDNIATMVLASDPDALSLPVRLARDEYEDALARLDAEREGMK